MHDRHFIPLDKTPEREGYRDGRTDGQTDLLWLLQRSALRAMRTRCKNCPIQRSRQRLTPHPASLLKSLLLTTLSNFLLLLTEEKKSSQISFQRE